jgi:hypothetical protein
MKKLELNQMEMIEGGENECVIAVATLSFGLLAGFFTGGLSIWGTAAAAGSTAIACLADTTK